jgi:hypothetical protein
MKKTKPKSASIHRAAILLVITFLFGCSSTDKTTNKTEKGPDGTIAYLVHVETSEPGARIELDGNYVGLAPLDLKIYGDRDGTFHNFGSMECVIRASPSGNVGQEQFKVFRTGGLFTQEDRIPKQIFFSMTAPQVERRAQQPDNGAQRLVASLIYGLSQAGNSSSREPKPGNTLFTDPTVAAQANEPRSGKVLFTNPTLASQSSNPNLTPPSALNANPAHQNQKPQKLMLFGGVGHKIYLGCISCELDAEDSIFNVDGPKGKSITGKISQESIWNTFGPFGDKFSDSSPWNKLGNNPPIIVDQNGNSYGYFTLNKSHPNQTKIPELLNLIQMITPE